MIWKPAFPILRVAPFHGLKFKPAKIRPTLSPAVNLGRLALNWSNGSTAVR